MTPATLSKTRLQHRCFSLNFAIFLRKPFLMEQLRWLLLSTTKSVLVKLQTRSFLLWILLWLCLQELCEFFKTEITLNNCEWLLHRVKSVEIRSYFWSVFSCIQSEYRKIRTRNNSVFGQFSTRDFMIFDNLQPNTWGFIISIINNKFNDKYHDS